MRVGEVDHVFGRKAERQDEAFAQFRQKVQGAAQKGDLAPDGAATGQPADGLIDDGLNDGGGEVFAGRALVEQGHHVRLGEDAAARGDGVDGGGAGGQLIEPGGVGVQKGGHLIDEGPGPARAGFVHAQVHALAEIEDFGVLAAEFHGDIGLRGERGKGPRCGDHLLHEGQAEDFRKPERGRAGDGSPDAQAGVVGGETIQHGGKRSPGGRPVTHVMGLKQFSVRRDERELRRRRAHVEAQKDFRIHADSPSGSHMTPPDLFISMTSLCVRAASTHLSALLFSAEALSDSSAHSGKEVFRVRLYHLGSIF